MTEAQISRNHRAGATADRCRLYQWYVQRQGTQIAGNMDMRRVLVVVGGVFEDYFADRHTIVVVEMDMGGLMPRVVLARGMRSGHYAA